MAQTFLAWVSLTGINPALPGDVVIYDLTHNKVLGMIPVGVDPRYLAWSSSQNKIYVPNKENASVTVIDGDTFEAVKTIPVGQDPRKIIIDEVKNKGYVFNYSLNTLTILDLEQDEVQTTVPLEGAPLGMAFSPDGEKLYVTLHNAYSLAILDSTTFEIIQTLPLGAYPSNLVLDPQRKTLYVVISGENRVAVLDSEELKVIGNIPVGENPQNIILHPALPLAYVSNFSSDSVSVISLIEQKEIKRINSVVTPNVLAFLPDGSKLLVTGDYQITVIDISSQTVEKNLYSPPTAQIRQGIVVTPTAKDFISSEEVITSSKRPYAYTTERVYFRPPPPFNITLTIEFPTKSAKPQRLMFDNAEVNNQTLSLIPIPQRPKYYSATFAFQIPIRIHYLNENNEMQEYQDRIHHVATEVDIYLPNFNGSLNLMATTLSQLVEKRILSPNSMELKIESKIIALQQVHIKE